MCLRQSSRSELPMQSRLTNDIHRAATRSTSRAVSTFQDLMAPMFHRVLTPTPVLHSVPTDPVVISPPWLSLPRTKVTPTTGRRPTRQESLAAPTQDHGIESDIPYFFLSSTSTQVGQCRDITASSPGSPYNWSDRHSFSLAIALPDTEWPLRSGLYFPIVMGTDPLPPLVGEGLV